MEKIFDIQQTILEQHLKTDVFERDIYREFTFDNLITGVVGMRGIGKTTLLLSQAIKAGAQKGNALYTSADNLYFLENNLFDLADYCYKNTDIKLLCIDEIHKYANWAQELKNIADTFPSMRVLFTGSSMIDIIHGKYDLSRRVTLKHLHGLSFREYLKFNHDIDIPKISFNDLLKNPVELSHDFHIEKILQKFKHYIRIGYYPAHREFSLEHEMFQTIENATQKTIYEDIAVFHSLKTESLRIIEKLFQYIINSQPGELSAYKLASTLEKDYSSISHFLHYLEQAGLIRFLYTNQSGKAYLRNPTKMYPDNTNLIYASYLPQTQENTIGKIRETFALAQLQNANLNARISKDGDFVIDDVVLEIGGKNKTNTQVKHLKKSYVFADDITIGSKTKIPIYLLGFLN